MTSEDSGFSKESTKTLRLYGMFFLGAVGVCLIVLAQLTNSAIAIIETASLVLSGQFLALYCWTFITLILLGASLFAINLLSKYLTYFLEIFFELRARRRANTSQSNRTLLSLKQED